MFSFFLSLPFALSFVVCCCLQVFPVCLLVSCTHIRYVPICSAFFRILFVGMTLIYWLVAKYNFTIIRSMRLLPPFHSLWQRRLYLSYLSMIPTHPTSDRGARLFFERLHTLKSSLYSYTIHLTQNLTRYFLCNTLVIWKCKNKW